MKLYKLFWTNEGILYRRRNFILIKPKTRNGEWMLRKVHGEPGSQSQEWEGDFTSEREAFGAGNRAVRRDLFKRG